MSILVILFTTILVSAFIKNNINMKFTNSLCIIFSCVYLSFSLNNELFLFQASNFAVLIGNLLTIACVIFIYEININNIKGIKNYIWITLIMAFAISLYESCCQTFLVGIFLTVILRIVTNNEKENVLIKYLLKNIMVLALAIIVNYAILELLFLIGVPSELGGKTIYWFQYGIKDGLMVILSSIVKYIFRNIKYFPVLEFVVCIILCEIISIIYSINKKNINIFNLTNILIFSNVAISVIQCKTILYRTCLSWNLVVAATVTVLYCIVRKNKIIKNIITIFIVILICWQTRDLNQWFYSDYLKYQKDLNDAFTIADDIRKVASDTNKPIVFVGTPNDGFQMEGQIGSQSNGLSVIWWGEKAFDDNSYELIKFINSLGYNFKKPTDEQYKEGQEKTNDMSTFPKEGYIKELEDIIIVKFK